MPYGPIVRRVVVVILDGLRPDAIGRFELSTLGEMMSAGAWTLRAVTVAPSVTTSAVTSLVTGVSPATHGLAGDRLVIPRAKSHLVTLPRHLGAHSLPSSAFMAEVPAIFRGISVRVGRRLGLASLSLAGSCAAEVLAAARRALAEQRTGTIIMHWPDADHAGHRDGWMSAAYAAGCRRLDEALDGLVQAADDGHTLIVALADHGGGGCAPNDHDGDHPLNRTIPILLYGPGVAARELGPATLVDVPPTILRALGVSVPESYEGRILREAFVTDERSAAAVA